MGRQHDMTRTRDDCLHLVCCIVDPEDGCLPPTWDSGDMLRYIQVPSHESCGKSAHWRGGYRTKLTASREALAVYEQPLQERGVDWRLRGPILDMRRLPANLGDLTAVYKRYRYDWLHGDIPAPPRDEPPCRGLWDEALQHARAEQDRHRPQRLDVVMNACPTLALCGLILAYADTVYECLYDD